MARVGVTIMESYIWGVTCMTRAVHPTPWRSAPLPTGAPGGHAGSRRCRSAPPGTSPLASASPFPCIGHMPHPWSWYNAPARMSRRRGLALDHRRPRSPLGRHHPPASCRPASWQRWLISPSCSLSSARPEERWSARNPWWEWCGEEKGNIDR